MSESTQPVPIQAVLAQVLEGLAPTEAEAQQVRDWRAEQVERLLGR